MENRHGNTIRIEKTFATMKTYRRFYNGEEKGWRGWYMLKDSSVCKFSARTAQALCDGGDWDVRVCHSNPALEGQRPAPESLTSADFPLTVHYF